MLGRRITEYVVGLFLLLGFISLGVLAFKVSGLRHMVGIDIYEVTASFENIGGLKVRSPVTLAGVRVGEISKIELDKESYKAKVTMQLYVKDNFIPDDSTASIFTEGLLGANYVGFTPGFSETYLQEGSDVEETHSALILEDLIGQVIFNVRDDNEK